MPRSLSRSVFAGAAHAQVVAGLDGRWEGSLDTPEGPLPVVLRVSTTAGKTTTVLDSPTQGAMDIPATADQGRTESAIDVAAVGGELCRHACC